MLARGGPALIGLFRELGDEGNRPFDSGLFALQFRIVRSKSADGPSAQSASPFFTEAKIAPAESGGAAETIVQ